MFICQLFISIDVNYISIIAYVMFIKPKSVSRALHYLNLASDALISFNGFDGNDLS